MVKLPPTASPEAGAVHKVVATVIAGVVQDPPV
jgi:hypothetical protein